MKETIIKFFTPTFRKRLVYKPVQALGSQCSLVLDHRFL